MTISGDAGLWTADAWAARLASGNPVFPYEWEVHYRTGPSFPRVAHGRARTSAAVDLVGIRALRIRGPGVGVLDLAPGPGPVEALVLRARVVGLLGHPGIGGVTGWTFGFRHATGFHGVRLAADGTLVAESVTPSGIGVAPCV